MKRKNTNRTETLYATLQKPLKLSGLQARMTFSYVWVTIASILILEILTILVVLCIALFFLYQRSNTTLSTVNYTVKKDARQIASQLTTKPLTTLQLGDPNEKSLLGGILSNGSSNIPRITSHYSANQPIAFELLITPDGNVAASSYPTRYTIKTPITQLVPYATQVIHSAMAGISQQGTFYSTSSGFNIGAAEPVRYQQRIVGTLYVEVPFVGIPVPDILKFIGLLLLISSVVVLIFAVPIGGIFGLITTRGVVRRLGNLVSATTLFADGNYEQRVSVTRKDEVGQLEQQFNRMAEQLVESIAQRQALAERNARLAERSRISRELHDAISQDLFSLSMLSGGLQTALPQDSSLQPQIAMLGTTTTSVIREMRALLLELRPLQLEELGLAESLKEIANSYSIRLGITVSTEIASVQLNAKAQHTLLRISQEALANAVRHANATTITLSLIPFADHITFTIRDNGSGFDPAKSKMQHGLGLRLMQERIQELDGTFTLQSTPGHGTWIHICLPQEHACD